MTRLWVLIALLWASTARADRWVLIRPKPLDQGSERLAAELTHALDRILSEWRGERRVGNILSPDEALTVLDCLELNANCAERAARAVNADGTIFATVRRAGARVLVEMERISSRSRRSLAWRIDLQGHRPTRRELGRLADALSTELMAPGAAVETGVFSDGRLDVRLDGRRQAIDGLLALRPGSHRIVAGGETLQIDLLPGELVLLHRMRAVGVAGRVDPEPETESSTQAKAGWVVFGVGATALVGSGLVGLSHLNTIDQYENARSARVQKAEAAAARDEVTAINTLLAVGGGAILTGLILLLTD